MIKHPDFYNLSIAGSIFIHPATNRNLSDIINLWPIGEVEK
jgi:hypothetical protein